MFEKAEIRDRIQYLARRPAAEELKHHTQPACSEKKTQRSRNDECDDLVPGRCRDERTDREIAAGHEKTPEIAGCDDSIIRRPEVVDGDPDGCREQQTEPRNHPRGNELPQYGAQRRHREREQQLDGAALALFRPEPHEQWRA